MMDRLFGQIVISIWFIGIVFAVGCDQKPKGDKKVETRKSIETDSVEIEKSKVILSHRTLGLAYLEDNNLEEAEAEFKKLVELAPNEALGYANLGIVYMRMGKYEEAEAQLIRAVEIKPDDPDIRLNLAKVYDLTNMEDASRRELEKTIEIDPEHVQSLYSLAESYQNLSDEYSVNQWEKYLRKIADTAPSNIVARIYLVEVLIRNEQADEALEHLEEIERISAVFPDEAMDYYRSAINQLQTDSFVEALTSVRIFHNLIKLTNSYQTDIRKLKGSTASRVGIPVISFSEARPAFLMDGESLLDVIKFTDVTASAGLEVLSDLILNESGIHPVTTHIASGDMDRDGDQDIYVAGYNAESGRSSHYLMQNNMGRFKNITAESGLDFDGIEYGSIFSDYNNDGFLDLYITKDGPNLLYENVSEGVFEDVSERAEAGDDGMGRHVLFFDIDQEGDLDIVLANQNSTRVYRNNGDNTFTNITDKTSFGDNEQGCRDALFGDFDDDGDVDLFLIHSNGHHRMYFNMRDGNFLDVTEESGLFSTENSNSAASGDLDNDGFEDLFIVKKDQNPALYINRGDGTFSIDASNKSIFSILDGVIGHDVLFFDFDNDGHLDILFAGEQSSEGEKGVFLFHNTGSGKFEDASFILPEDLYAGSAVMVMDYNEDGDMDILISDTDRGVRLLRNDGGNSNHHLKVQLVGIRTGSGKNNHYGIGAKVEVRAGELYQMKTVTEPAIHFGLGTRDKVDVVRILWTNGVPQNIFSPGSDQDLIEEQELKGSCPFLYVWNGERYEFLKDMMWRSALGMPLGIMGGTTTYAFANASEEYLKIPGDNFKAEDQKYYLQVTAELWETVYFDKLQLFVVDHPGSTDIFVDEKFTGPPFPEFKMYHVNEKRLPRSVTDGSGVDLLSQISERDDQYITNLHRAEYQGITELHDLIVDFGYIDPDRNLVLFMNGWIFPTDASINVAMSQSASCQVLPPFLQILNNSGDWETIINDIGFPSGKDKTIIVDLTGKIPMQSEPVIRIRTNMEIYWDYLFYSTDPDKGPYISSILSPEVADLHYRGFSATYRKGGRYGPFWFDYAKVDNKPKWRDLQGNYTRFGDVLDLLIEADNKYVIMNAGDEITVTFGEEGLPALPEGWKRDFIIYSVGWVKDGDLNTAFGNKAEPYPYHGMTAYPNGTNIEYPYPDGMERHFKKYNTREVSNEVFRNEIRSYVE
jgi:tetratricopeptide (TPR) repeat protein